jgi:predicted TIM-barrel fold metal-dependent hydrolase
VGERDLRITNCHIHTFTVAHVPDRFAGIFGRLLEIRWLRAVVLAFLRAFGRAPRSLFARYARILEVSHRRSQRQVFELARSFYPQGTRFVVLPMDMAYMNAGHVSEPLAAQHDGLRKLHDEHGELVLPFVAVDPRRPDVVATTIELLEEEPKSFFGIKLYPPLGYHPNDPRLGELYDYAAERDVPILSHCTRRGVQYRGRPTPDMLSPGAGSGLSTVGDREAIVRLADPDNYKAILSERPKLRLCLAHFGGDEEWEKYLNQPWVSGGPSPEKSWLAKIADMIRSRDYENLYTDIAYTVFADEENVYLLKVLLSDERIRERVLFGSDFYVVENAKLEERRISVRVRSVLGEDLFRQIAEINPARFLQLDGATARGT